MKKISVLAKEMSTTQSKFNVGFWVISLSVLSIFSLIINLLVQIFLAREFGTSIEMDAYIAASTIPNLISIVLTGSISITLVPIYIRYIAAKRHIEAWNLVSALLLLTAVGLAIIIIVGIIFAPQILNISVPGFRTNPTQTSLAIQLFRISLPSILFTITNALLSGVYYANQKYFLPSIIPIIQYGTTLLSIFFLGNLIGIKSVPIGMLFGGLIGSTILLPILFREGRFHPNLKLSKSGIAEVIRLGSIWIAASFLTKSNPVLDNYVVSLLPQGALSYLGYSRRITNLIVISISAGISKVIFPIISKVSAELDDSKLSKSIVHYFLLVAYIAIPVVIIMSISRIPLVGLMLERDKFNFTDTVSVSNALMGYSLAIVSLSLGNIITPVFYARKDTLTPAVVGLTGLLIYVLLLSPLTNSLEHIGPAVAYSIISTLNIIIMLIILRSRLRIDLRHISTQIVKILLIAAFMTIIIFPLFTVISDEPGNLVNRLFVLIVVWGVGLGVFFMTSMIIKIQPAIMIYQWLKSVTKLIRE